MQGINVIAGEDVPDNSIDKISALGQTRVEIELAVGILEEPLRVLIVDVSWSRLVLFAACDTVWIYPRMQLHAALVGLLNHELQRIPHGLGSLARFAREPTGPRFQIALIGRIGLRANLPDNGIAIGTLQQVQLIDEVFLGLLGCHLGILFLSNDVHPSSTELIFGQSRFVLISTLCHKATG